MTHAGLFSGIGGFSLAAQWMGWTNVFDVELDPWCRQVLHRNFPTTQLFDDVCSFDATAFRGRIDVLSGGFPCQPFSLAGKGLGAADPRALWPQMLRVIRECQPRFVVGENVRGLLSNAGGVAFEGVCADLEAEGYDVLPFLLPAAGVGAPHHRDRFWFVAHARRCPGNRGEDSQQRSEPNGQDTRRQETPGEHKRLCQAGAAPNAHGEWQPQPGGALSDLGRRAEHGGQDLVGYAARIESHEQPRAGEARKEPARTLGATDSGAGWRLTQPPLCGGNDGVPAGLVRPVKHRAKQLKAYGNSIVPQVAYQIFLAIAQADVALKT